MISAYWLIAPCVAGWLCGYWHGFYRGCGFMLDRVRHEIFKGGLNR